MNTREKPSIDHYRRQMLVCVGPYCTDCGMTPGALQHMTSDDVVRLIDEHLVGGRVVEDLLFHRGPGADGSAAPGPGADAPSARCPP